MATSTGSQRKDAQRTRNRLLDAMSQLLQERGLDFSLPDLARVSQISTATVYRHFDDVSELRNEYYARIVTSLVEQFRALLTEKHGLELFEAACLAWVESSEGIARAATFIRNPAGVLERVKGDPAARQNSGLYETLTGILGQLVEEGVLPEQDLDYAYLIWITLFDERVFVDLLEVEHMTPADIASRLGTTVLLALGQSLSTAD